MDIERIAHLARLQLNPEEKQQFESQIDQILSYVEKLNEIDVDDIEPMAHANPVFDVLRPDDAEPRSLSQEAALSNAPQKIQDQFRVPKVVE